MVEIAALGGFHVGGRDIGLSGLPLRDARMTAGGPLQRIDMNGDHVVEQAYVHYVRLAKPRAPMPVLFIHGGGMTGVTWEDTPDGRPGWQMRFLEAGWNTYVADAVERGRSGWAPFPEVFPEPPLFRTKQLAWALFRFGPKDGYASDPAARRPYPGQRFPIAALDAFHRQCVPRWACNDAATIAAYAALLDRIGPVAIVCHSQGGNLSFASALASRGKVSAIVAVEPSGAPDPGQTDLAAVSGVPHLFVWGDYLDGHPAWRSYRPAIDRYAAALDRAELLDLPARGIRGNSHFPMMDDNSDEVAALVLAWLARISPGVSVT
jgi:pimeloyl-ACP methyl ester carboxylesterase